MTREDIGGLSARSLYWLRWPLILPASVIGGFLAGSVIYYINLSIVSSSEHTWAPIAYAGAFLSGLAHVWVALLVVYAVAPSHKKLVVAVLAVFFIGDLSFVHLVLPGMVEDSFALSSGDTVMNAILSALRADDFDTLKYGGYVKVAGALTACILVRRIWIRE